MPRYRHIHLVGAAATARYTATRARSPEFRTPGRQRRDHAERLIGSLTQARQQQERFPNQVGNGFYESPGLLLTFESDPDFPLAFESLDLQRSKIQLLSVKKDEQNRTIATLLVPGDKLAILIRKLEAYRDFDPENPQGRENGNLVNSISNIKLATLRELWTDASELYPAANIPITWEVWLRPPLDREQAPVEKLRGAAADFGYEVVSNALEFVDRTVVLVQGTREVLSRSADLLGIIAEVRKAKTTAEFFSALICPH